MYIFFDCQCCSFFWCLEEWFGDDFLVEVGIGGGDNFLVVVMFVLVQFGDQDFGFLAVVFLEICGKMFCEFDVVIVIGCGGINVFDCLDFCYMVIEGMFYCV